MNKKQFQSGSAHLIIIMVLCVALIGALGFVYWQNFMQPKTSGENVVATKTTDDTTTTITTPAVAPATAVNNFLTSFLNYMAMPTTDSHNETSFASQSTVLTDTYKDSIVNPSGMVYVSPIILAQDIPISFTVGNATTTDNISSVPVTLNFATPSNIIYSLVIVNNEWKISGVVKA